MKRKGRQFFVSDFASADGQNKTRKNAFGSAEIRGNADSSDACNQKRHERFYVFAGKYTQFNDLYKRQLEKRKTKFVNNICSTNNLFL